jgi:hypothetical protein
MKQTFKQKKPGHLAGLSSFLAKFWLMRRANMKEAPKAKRGSRGRRDGRGQDRSHRRSPQFATAAALGGGSITVLHLYGTAVSVAMITWGTAVVLVGLVAVVMLLWTYVFGDETRSGRVWRFLGLVARWREPSVQQPALVQVPECDAPDSWPGQVSGGQHSLASRVLDTAGSRRAKVGCRSARARTHPALPAQRSGPGGYRPRITTPRREARPGRRS